MPIYEYQCNHCGHEFEVMQKFSDSPIKECRVCKGEVTKLISQSTFHLKGTGWYATDYANKSGSGGNVSKAKDSSDSGKESAAKTSAASSADTGTSSAPKSD